MQTGTGRIWVLSLVTGMVLVSGCKHEPGGGATPSDKPGNGLRELVARLEKAGYYRFAKDPNTAKGAVSDGKSLYAAATGRVCAMDTEKLAKGGVRDFVEACRPVLEAHGIKLESVAQVFVIEYGYLGLINGKEYMIYSEEETYSDNLWNLAAKGTVAMGNALFTDAGSDERMYMAGTGHDAVAVFLTEEQYQVLTTSALAESEKPKSADAIVKP